MNNQNNNIERVNQLVQEEMKIISVPNSLRDNLNEISKSLGIEQRRIVTEVIVSGLEIVKEKYLVKAS
jgi:predicted DNA-binding protein